MKLNSADELLKLARQHMLQGRPPVSAEDWIRVTNFIAAQLEPRSAEGSMEFIRVVLKIPLSPEDVRYVVKRQVEARSAEAN